MKSIHFQGILVTLFLGACSTGNTQESTSKQTSTKPLTIERSKLFENYSEEKIQIANFIEEYLNIMHDSSIEVRNGYWNSEILTSQQDRFLYGGLARGFLAYYPPKLMGIQALENRQFLAKISFEENGFSLKIMNLKIAFDGLNRPYFIDLLGENLKKFNQVEFENYIFYYSPLITRDESLERKTKAFNEELATLFEISPLPVKIIALKNIRDYCNVLGYEYSTVLTYDSQTGGIALPTESIIFSANGTAYYPHELVHLYTAKYNAHYWFDEGLATYLGGSVEYPLEYHLTKIANRVNDLDFSILPEEKKLDDETSFKYAIGGLFCKLAFEEYGGKPSLMKLMNSGKEEDDFFNTLKEVFEIDKSELDNFIREALAPYVSKE